MDANYDIYKITGYLDFFDRKVRRGNYNKRVAREHWQNIADYLCYYIGLREERDIGEWCGEIDDFIMHGFLGKRPVSALQLKTMCGSIRRFYLYMRDNGFITFEEYDHVKDALRNGHDKWCEVQKQLEEDQGGWIRYARQRGGMR